MSASNISHAASNAKMSREAQITDYQRLILVRNTLPSIGGKLIGKISPFVESSGVFASFYSGVHHPLWCIISEQGNGQSLELAS